MEPEKTVRLKINRYSLDHSASALTTVREFIRATLFPFAQAAPFTEDIVSATHEAAKNAVEHNDARTGPVQVVCEVTDQSVVVEVSDRGSGFDPSILPPGCPGPEEPAGRGLFIIYSLMDEVITATGEGGTRVRMVKLTGAAP